MPGPAHRDASRLIPMGAAVCLTIALTAQLASAASPGTGAGDVRVAVEDFAFTPSSVTIEAGASVVWAIRKDPEQHTVTPVESGSFKGSGQLFAGDDFAVRFDVPGRYRYACMFHPFMRGSVVVVNAEDVTPPASPAVSTPASPTSAEPAVPGDPSPTSVGPGTDATGGGPGTEPVLGAALLILTLTVGLAGAVVRHRQTG